MPGSKFKPMGNKGKKTIKIIPKTINSTARNMKVEGITIIKTMARSTRARYAATYPPTPVTCLPFIVIVVVPVKKLMAIARTNIPIMTMIVFFLFQLFTVSIINQMHD